MAKLGEDVTEVLDYVPGHFQVIRHVRPKYACTACDAITQAPAPAMPTPRGRATPATLAHLLVAKYCDHLPLYRQSEIYAREGLELDRSTLCDWVGQAAWLLDPVVAAIRRHVFAAEKIHGDDTTVPVLAPGLGRTKTGRLWVYVRDDRPFAGAAAPAAAYFYSPDRGGEHPAAHMASFTGFLQADGYAGFEALYDPARTKPGPITEVACWAHCRRKFFDVWEATKSPVAKEALDRIAAIYAIEAKARFAPAAERVAHRARDRTAARRVLRLGRSDRGQSCRRSRSWPKRSATSINRREALTRFVTDGRLEVDNNIAENAMRGHRAWPQELPLRGFGFRRRAGSVDLHHRADGQAERPQPGNLSQRHPDQDRRRASHQPDRRADAVADDRHRSGRAITVADLQRHKPPRPPLQPASVQRAGMVRPLCHSSKIQPARA